MDVNEHNQDSQANRYSKERDMNPEIETAVRELVREEIDQVLTETESAHKTNPTITRRQLLTALGVGSLGVAGLAGGASQPAAAAPDGSIGEPGSVLNAVYTAAIKDTNDATLIDFTTGGPIDLKVPLNLYQVASDPGSPSVGDMWYRSDLD